MHYNSLHPSARAYVSKNGISELAPRTGWPMIFEHIIFNFTFSPCRIMTAKYSNREFMLHMFCSDYSVIAHLEKVSCALSLNVVNHHVSRWIVTTLTSDALAVSYATAF